MASERRRRASTRWAIISAAAIVSAGLLSPGLAAEDVVYTVIDGKGVPEPLTDIPANPDRGGVIYLDPKRGGCGACHRSAALPDQGPEATPAAPELDRVAGPDLDGVAARYSPAELRLLVVNPRILHPESAMPAYFNISAELAARDPDAPQPLLTAREVEDVVAFLQTLTAD